MATKLSSHLAVDILTIVKIIYDKFVFHLELRQLFTQNNLFRIKIIDIKLSDDSDDSKKIT